MVSRRARRRWHVLRPVADALAALAVFFIASLTITCAPTSANPQIPGHMPLFNQSAPAIANANDTPSIVEIATTSSPQAADAVYRRTSWGAAWLLLSLAFSLVIAFNLAFLRHMRRAYARKGASTTPRKSQG